VETKIPNGLPAPDFTLNDLSGRPYTLSDLRNRVVILNFWSAECPWARRTDEKLIPMMEEWDETIILLPVASNANEEPALLRQVAEERNLPVVLHDKNQRVASLYGAQTTPHIFLIDEEGILRYQGAFDDVTFRQETPTQGYLRDAIDATLTGDQPDPANTPPYGCAIVQYE
jgi:peroxiredoxin